MDFTGLRLTFKIKVNTLETDTGGNDDITINLLLQIEIQFSLKYQTNVHYMNPSFRTHKKKR